MLPAEGKIGMLGLLLLGGLTLDAGLWWLCFRRVRADRPFRYGEDADRWQASMDQRVEECRARRG